MKPTDLRKTVKDFRHALGKTQTEFGRLIGKSLPTVQRYESLAPPRGGVLFQLEEIAREHHLSEYAFAFQCALAEELGWPAPKRRIAKDPQRWHLREELGDVYDECIGEALEEGLTVTGIHIEFDRSDGRTRIADIALPTEQQKKIILAERLRKEEEWERRVAARPRSNPRRSEKKK
jgi:transcriptional regulator with XRE-family HTH domain